MTDVIRITDVDFAANVLRARIPVLLEIWDPWCGLCDELASQLQDVARQTAGDLLVARANVRDCHSLPRRLGICFLPTLIFFIGGAEVARITGLLIPEELFAFVEMAGLAPAPRQPGMASPA